MDDGQKHNDQVFAHNLCETCSGWKKNKNAFHNTYWQICTWVNAIIESKNKYMGDVFSVVVFYFTDNEIDPFEKPI